ncbi:hypothetical protein HD806DRAFT_476317 [Xylariaceae sp. AK1471]|nr:hypothetical protein HD806DRAFT_476317 [Xylariaceae sp. AK1471]
MAALFRHSVLLSIVVVLSKGQLYPLSSSRHQLMTIGYICSSEIQSDWRPHDVLGLVFPFSCFIPCHLHQGSPARGLGVLVSSGLDKASAVSSS